ncbi:hypothetical protein EYF80_046068 [Liparis tanakae]|uniref:Uncharacterized protein n=1 Tax=Liparis tanakae TaxID=230148 RepID=A0A4Z2FSI0_9TELE|nr:hypothetical protein EYF80_046068 [Liparis tanakae]
MKPALDITFSLLERLVMLDSGCGRETGAGFLWTLGNTLPYWSMIRFLVLDLRPRGSLSSSLMRHSSWQLSYRKLSSSPVLRRFECWRSKDHASTRHLGRHNKGEGQAPAQAAVVHQHIQEDVLRRHLHHWVQRPNCQGCGSHSTGPIELETKMSALPGADFSQPGDLCRRFGDYLQVWKRTQVVKTEVHQQNMTQIRYHGSDAEEPAETLVKVLSRSACSAITHDRLNGCNLEGKEGKKDR